MKHLILLAALLPLVANAGGYTPKKTKTPKPEPTLTTDVRATGTGGSSKSISNGFGGSSKSISKSGDSQAGSKSISKGGDAKAKGGDADASAVSGNNTIDGGDVLVQGDRIDYDVAAHKQTMILNGCQVGGAADSIKYGVQIIKQSPACMLLQSSGDALLFAASMQCADFAGSIAKGASLPDASSCLVARSKLVEQALAERNYAVDLLKRDAKQGVLKVFVRKIW